MNDAAATLVIRFAIVSAATLMLAVMFIERNKHLNLTPAQQPPAPGTRLLHLTNVPPHRSRDAALYDVAFLDATEVTDDYQRP